MQYSTGYILAFSAAVCVVCALFVSVASVSLAPRQERNILLDRQKNVLNVSGLVQPGESLSAAEIEERFSKFIRPVVIDLKTGEVNPQIDATTFDQQAASRDVDLSRPAPSNPSRVLRIPNQALIYEVVGEEDTVESIILPIQGYGLWSTLYGYLALAPDMNTIRGITFYDQKETAGLGGEVENPRWKALWAGRRVFDDRGTIKIEVKKGSAGSPAEDPYAVDGLSGATITGRGVTNMLHFWLGNDGFGPFIAKRQAGEAPLKG